MVELIIYASAIMLAFLFGGLFLGWFARITIDCVDTKLAEWLTIIFFVLAILLTIFAIFYYQHNKEVIEAWHNSRMNV